MDNQILYSNIGIEVVRDSTSNFKAPENLVVLECVDRLLTLGYRPEHIVLEPHWKVGHGASGGFGDILVKDGVGKDSYIIIECKVYGTKYDKELRDLKANGGQLFTYFKEEPSTKWLTLYASKVENDDVIRIENTISVSDDENIKLLAKKDKSILLFSDFGKADELYNVWKETYGLKLWQHLIFSKNTQPYNIGISPLKKKDLKDFTPDDKIVNRFEEILRHNNVSDKENSFNRLVALFICKLVDEIRKGDEDIVEFQYKQGSDTYETLQDRLQRLHKEGMEDFMKENIFYVPAEYPEWLFSHYTGQERKHAIEDLKNTIKILKFYSNNDFSFKDVHNEELFLQNGKILVEVVQLFENYRIVYPSKHQFLGDLFEQLLNKGFKQNEGQFFTPMPITRFIWDALPIRSYIESEQHIPKIIDYACGAGHFLTEAVETINSFIPNVDNHWVRNSIYGIEKDYRLARVAKISLFMNGAGEGNIIFSDGLDNASEKGITNENFSILVANPPYSVSGFKAHLKLKNNSFELTQNISNEGGEIETLFVERIAQLLKPKGIAAVILPVSMLSNDTLSYEGARRMLLENFYIRGLVNLGDKTFGATGTKTIILFLEKFNEPPKRKELIADCVDAICYNRDTTNWHDKEIFSSYLDTIGITQEVFYSLIDGMSLNKKEDELEEYERMYISSFNELTETKKRKQTTSFKRLSEIDKFIDLKNRFSAYVAYIEKKKLYYFSLAYNQQTCIISSPTDNDEQKKFLGYSWSKRKGQEGIKISDYGGFLFNQADREDNTVLAAAIRNSFLGCSSQINPKYQEFVKTIFTAEMLDFSRDKFDISIKTTPDVKIEIQSKFPVDKLGNHSDISKGQSITSAQAQSGNIKVVAGGKGFAYFHNESNRPQNTVTISASGANAGFVNFWEEPIFASDCVTINAQSETDIKFIYLFLLSLQDQIFKLQKGAGQPHVYAKDISILPFPLVDPATKSQIVQECSKVQEEYRNTRMEVSELHKKIKKIFSDLDVSLWGGVKLSDNQHFNLIIEKRILNSELEIDGTIPVYSANVFTPFGYVNYSILDDFSKGSVIWGIDGDWMTNYITPNQPFNPTDHCGVLRVVSNVFNPHFVKFFVEIEGEKVGFSRSYRASLDRVSNLTIPKIPIEKTELDNNFGRGVSKKNQRIGKETP